MIRLCTPDGQADILRIVNDGAQAYKGVIPADCWHEPYMSSEELHREIGAGVAFSCFMEADRVLGVMGIQDVKDVTLIRHAYVAETAQHRGIGTALLNHLRRQTHRPLLIGAWADAVWAIRFYQKHGFFIVDGEVKERLLRTYWTVPDRQIETSVMLAEQGNAPRIASA